ncbi:MAG: hypothetical protein H0U97_07485 [Gammaproteobacteria bacterium]|nr:hypothetical protein [Gammaproteobacteria bacterium]
MDTTTTDSGNTVPYIVRTEKGTMDRGIYQVAVLYDPSEPWTPYTPQPGWNGKLLYVFGAGSGTQYRQASPQSVADTRALSRGFAVANSSLNINGNQANHVLAAETMMMLKEHIVETYGPIRYTMGMGCSGASIQQQRIGNAYPGLLQGIQPNCSYPDTWTVRMEVGDCLLFNNYFQNTSPGLWGDVAQRAAVTGYQTPSSGVAWEALFGTNGAPGRTCGLPAERHYHPQNNPDGVRCSTSDYEINLWGTRPPEVWGPVEQQIGHGFAKVVYNNHGILYGLNAVRNDEITPEQFVDLNEKIGGKDVDWVIIPNRTDADPGAVGLAYRAGLVNDFSQLDKLAIIDLRGTSNNEIHTDFHSHEHRERLDRANGHHNNQIIWRFPSSIVIPPAIADASFFLLDRWLTAIKADSAAGTLEEKVVRNKPADAVDQCWTDAGEGPPITDPAACAAAYPYFGAPRVAAGGPTTHDNVRCELARLPDTAPTDGYGSAPFVLDQWERLKATFPAGVCDWSKPLPDRQPSIPWLTFKAGPGGQPLGDPPVSVSVP